MAEEGPWAQGVYYKDYLKLNSILDSQFPVSRKDGKPAHEELLFIIIHQVYELWFKQILHEVESIIEIFSKDYVDEHNMIVVINRCQRIVEIQKILVAQFRVLETMDPLDFMDFRGFLSPASGFQSMQFRILENKLGLPLGNRNLYQQQHYKAYFKPEDAAKLEESEKSSSLFFVVQRWLERTPGLKMENYDFNGSYSRAIETMFQQEQAEVEKSSLSDEKKKERLEQIQKNKETFLSVADASKHDELVKEGIRRLSHKALLGALMINMYREEPIYNLPYQFLSLLVEIDLEMINWRHRHVVMVQKMIGSKVGTGNSSGYQYLRTTTTDRYKVFLDLTNVPTYLLPRDFLPPLPKEICDKLGYHK